MEEAQVQADVERVLRLLTMLVAGSGRTRSSLERALGLSSGHLAKILNGNSSLRVGQLLAMLGTLGVRPGEFFEQCVPEVPGCGAATSLLQADPDLQGNHSSLAPLAAAADFDAAVARALIRLLGGTPQRLTAVLAGAAGEAGEPELRSSGQSRGRRKRGSGPARSG
jgi:transcriptional regulator with XRE-family HTH domain